MVSIQSITRCSYSRLKIAKQSFLLFDILYFIFMGVMVGMGSLSLSLCLSLPLYGKATQQLRHNHFAVVDLLDHLDQVVVDLLRDHRVLLVVWVILHKLAHP